MKKSSKNEQPVMSIDEVAELYKNFAIKAKEAEASAKPYKEQLLDWAKDHPEDFDEKTLMFKNGVRVEYREGDKPKWDNNAVDYEWVGSAIDAGLGDAVTLSIVPKELPAKLGKEQKTLLKGIGYKMEKSCTYAVYSGEKK